LSGSSLSDTNFSTNFPESASTLHEQRCEDEPIRVPGSIQRHGFLLVLDEDEKHIVAASENT
jgi:light-regulated signal transduction histidine kinase (bacteriophytochrome)